MSWQRYQRGVRNLGGFAGGTSRLARPPQVLPEPDVKPTPRDCDLAWEQLQYVSGAASIAVPAGSGVALAFVVHNNPTPITPPGSPWVEEYTTAGTGWSWGVWSAPAASVSSFDFTATAGAGGYATTITTPGDVGPWQHITDVTTLTVTGNSYAVDYHATVAVLLAALPDDPAGDFSLLAYGGAGQGQEIGIWTFDGDVTVGHDGLWATTTEDPNERYIVAALFPYECG